jgi:hypothetical protein
MAGRGKCRYFWIIQILLLCMPVCAQCQSGPALSDAVLVALKTSDAIQQLFSRHADDIWPGYNLARRPLLIYSPGKWALLLNVKGDINEFTKPPSDWPALKQTALWHMGPYRDLAGQLAFNVAVGGNNVVAVPILDNYLQENNPEVGVFALVVHEAFHQFQNEAFSPIDSMSEERYPIQDRDNTALAFLEMQLLKKAVECSAGAGPASQVNSYLKRCVAVRDARWKRNAFVRSFEQQEEILEGTAKYVEVKSLALVQNMKYSQAFERLSRPLAEDFHTGAYPEYLLRDFDSRITDSSVSPEDMPRNRIYPVGAALGLLLDRFDEDWKNRVMDNRDVSFLSLLKNRFDLGGVTLSRLLAETKKRYRYKEEWKAADHLIKAYEDSFREGLTAFEAQGGRRIQIKVSISGLTRSRSSGAKRWTVDDGQRSLCSHYNVYTLRASGLKLNLSNVGVLEKNDWEAKTRNVTFFVPKITSVVVNGESRDPDHIRDEQFDTVELHGENADFTCRKPGSLRVTGNAIEIEVAN